MQKEIQENKISEKRTANLFGVSEPVVQVQESNFVSGGEEKLIVDLKHKKDIIECQSLGLIEFIIRKRSGKVYRKN